MNDRNILGRVLALVLLAGAVYVVRSIAHGGMTCPLGSGSSCVMAIPAAFPAPAVDVNAAPVEKGDVNGEDEDAKLEKKAPVVPPAAPK